MKRFVGLILLAVIAGCSSSNTITYEENGYIDGVSYSELYKDALHDGESIGLTTKSEDTSDDYYHLYKADCVIDQVKVTIIRYDDDHVSEVDIVDKDTYLLITGLLDIDTVDVDGEKVDVTTWYITSDMKSATVRDMTLEKTVDGVSIIAQY